MVPALSLRAVTKRYRSPVLGAFAPVTVLRDVDLDVALGEIVIAAGPAGAGKTTLLRCAAGIARLTAGRVLWFGTDAKLLSASSTVALIGESPHAPSTLAVEDAIRYHAAVSGSGVAMRADAAIAILDSLGLVSLRAARLSRLPPSVLRRVAIAEALGAGARVLLIDDRMGLTGAAGIDDLARYVLQLSREGVSSIVASRRRNSLPLLRARRLILQGGRLSRDTSEAADWTNAEHRGTITGK